MFTCEEVKGGHNFFNSTLKTVKVTSTKAAPFTVKSIFTVGLQWREPTAVSPRRTSWLSGCQTPLRSWCGSGCRWGRPFCSCRNAKLFRFLRKKMLLFQMWKKENFPRCFFGVCRNPVQSQHALLWLIIMQRRPIKQQNKLVSQHLNGNNFKSEFVHVQCQDLTRHNKNGEKENIRKLHTLKDSTKTMLSL